MMEHRKGALYKLGTIESDMDTLLSYTANVFKKSASGAEEDFLHRWDPVIKMAGAEGAAAAINRYLVTEELSIEFASPETLTIEMYPSIAGTIPIITTENTDDFESMLRNIVNKGRDISNISEMGASFAYGKSNRFIILSNKPYSNVSAEFMGLDETLWRKKSMIIRKHHECTHYYTKRFFGSARNNLHDELIADFCGIYAAFGEYKAKWFLKFLGISGDDKDGRGRIKVYTEGLSATASEIIEKIAQAAANGLEQWSKTSEFLRMSEIERVEYLCGKELLSICQIISNLSHENINKKLVF